MCQYIQTDDPAALEVCRPLKHQQYSYASTMPPKKLTTQLFSVPQATTHTVTALRVGLVKARVVVVFQALVRI